MRLKRAAKLTELSYESLRSAHFRGELAIVKIGGNADGRHAAWYVDVRELERWIASRTFKGGAAA